jgi:hypothetical protein
MTEAEWLAATDLYAMREALRAAGEATERRLRLFAAACCRRMWPLLADPRSRAAVEWMERDADQESSDLDADRIATAAEAAHADAEVPDGEPPGREEQATRIAVRNAAWGVSRAVSGVLEGGIHLCLAVGDVERAAAYAAWASRPGATGRAEEAVQCRLLRCLCGPRLFRSVRLDRAWLSWNAGTVARLAASAYEERSLPSGELERTRLAVLAEALEEAGCADPDILGHLREQGGVHVRGCWVVDLLLEQS